MTTRSATIERATGETSIRCVLVIDGSGRAELSTGLGFLDHMLTSLAVHAGFDLTLSCTGDTHVDDHHSVEDCCLVLGRALDEALGDRSGIERFGDALVPMDEALARAAVDLVTRPVASVELGLSREMLGDVACENLAHGLETLAVSARLTLHVRVLEGRNDHHRTEAAFKAVARALRAGVRRTGAADTPSTKGVV